MNVREEMELLRDEKYAAFQRRLIPELPPERVLGIRFPALRAMAASLDGEPSKELFLATLPHGTNEENLLHAILINRVRDYDVCIRSLETFLPYVDNWTVCDTLSPKVFVKHKPDVLVRVRDWIASPEPFVCRFGIGTLMRHFLDRDFEADLLALPAAVTSEHYYVRMMAAWFYATALAKQWNATVPYLTEERLPVWTHNQTIRKATESFRVPEERKVFLRTLRRRT